MEFKEIFDKRFPRHLRLKEFKENLVYLFEINKIDSLSLENKFLVKTAKKAKYI